MMYAQMVAPLAETFLADAETPAELLEASQQYIGAITELMRDPAMLTGLQSLGAAMWEVNQAIPSAEYLAASSNATIEVIDYLWSALVGYPVYVEQAGNIMIEDCKTAGQYISDAARAFANIDGTAVPMQHGAIITRPTYSLIGEAGYPEVVLPLGGGHKLTAHMEKGSEQQEVTVTIPLTVVTEDGRVLKQETISETMSEIKKRSFRREVVIYATGVK